MRRGLRRGALGAGLLLGALLTTSIAPAVSSASAPREYVVERGDTLSEIALNYGMTVQQLVWMNGIDDPDLIFPGQELALGAAGTGVASAESAVEPVSDEGTTDEVYEDTTQGGPQDYPPYYPPGLIQSLLIDAANRYGWDPNLIMAQAWQESYWHQDEVSWTGAIGVMQIMPETAEGMESWYFRRDMNVWGSAYDNIEMGVAFLSVLYQETGSVELALASYYQGWASVQEDGLFPETHEYVDRIFMLQDQFANGELP